MTTPPIPAPLPYRPARTRTDLFAALLTAAREFGRNKTIIYDQVDGEDRPITYKEVLRGAFGLGSALAGKTKSGESVGLMLPTGAGAVIGFYALSAYNRVPAMLNFTAGSRNLKAAMKAAEVTKIVTARKFVELAGLEALIKDLSAAARATRAPASSSSPPAPRASPRASFSAMRTSWRTSNRCARISAST